MVASAELILFAIRAGVRLGAEARRAYVDHTRQRELTLPLPHVNLAPDLTSAITWFSDEGERYLDEVPRLRALHEYVTRSGVTPDLDEKSEYMALYDELQRVEVLRLGGEPLVLAGGGALDFGAVLALVRLKQFEKGDPREPRTLPRFAGTIVELGIDYFATVPGALNRSSQGARVVAGVVDGLDRIPFAEIEFDEEGMREIAGRLLIAALETLSSQPELVTGDANIQELVAVATEGLACDVARGLKRMPDDLAAQERLAEWGELVFRSLLTTAGRKVVAEPARYLGVEDEARAVLVRRVGSAFLDVATRDADLDLRRAFGREGLDALASAALEAVAEHPELVLGDDDRFARLVGAIASDLAKEPTLFRADVIPEVGRLVLLHGGRNLPLIWKTDDPHEHLLLTAAQTTLSILAAEPPQGARWQPRFGRGDLLTVVDTVLDELSANPGWLIQAGRDMDANLGVALEAVLGVLRRRADDRLGASLAAEVLRESVKAVALRQELLAESAPEAVPFVAAAIDAVFEQLFKPGVDAHAQWQLLRTEAVRALVRIALRELASRSTLDAEALAALATVTAEEIARLTEGGLFSPDAFEMRLRSELAA